MQARVHLILIKESWKGVKTVTAVFSASQNILGMSGLRHLNMC